MTIMKSRMLVIMSAGLIVICALQWRSLRDAKGELAKIEISLQNALREREEQERKVVALEQRQSTLNAEMGNLSGLVTAFRTAEGKYARNVAQFPKPAPAEASAESKTSADEQEPGLFGKGMSGIFSRMMKDPSMKDLMRTQQKSMLNMMYGSMAKDLSLTTEQSEKLMELLLDQQLKAYADFQSQQLNMQKAVMKVTGSMFSNERGTGDSKTEGAPPK